jgi:hypothetical protein
VIGAAAFMFRVVITYWQASVKIFCSKVLLFSIAFFFVFGFALVVLVVAVIVMKQKQ